MLCCGVNGYSDYLQLRRISIDQNTVGSIWPISPYTGLGGSVDDGGLEAEYLFIISVECFDTVGWVIWPVKTVPIWPIMCSWDVKPYSINQSINQSIMQSSQLCIRESYACAKKSVGYSDFGGEMHSHFHGSAPASPHCLHTIWVSVSASILWLACNTSPCRHIGWLFTSVDVGRAGGSG